MNTSYHPLVFGADHAGVTLKLQCKEWLQQAGYKLEDLGAFGEEAVDYPDIAQKVAAIIAADASKIGLLFCGSGIGMSIAANRHPKIRAALCLTPEFARLARAHNDANILVLPARFLDATQTLAIIEVFLHTSFEGGRHLARINKLGVQL